MKTIAIIGGGFSGTATAINLARLSSVPLHISIINKSKLPCRGIAYSTRNSSHLLNVVARNMSALADQPNHFVEWLATRSEYLDEPMATLREKFVPRKLYGDYLQSLFQWYSRILADEKGMKLEFVQDEARDVFMDGAQANVVLAGGTTLKVDKVILAVGNQSPSAFRLPGLKTDGTKYIGNPWLGWEEKLPSNDQDVLLIGTGLTMVDTFLSLQDLAWKGKIYAVSRNGLLPLSHFKGFEYPDLFEGDMTSISLRKAVAVFKQHYRNTKARQLNPAILVDKLRPFTQRIWQGFSLAEKQQFNRRFRTRWNVTRHRIAPEIHQQLCAAIKDGRLEIIKARLTACEERDDKLAVSLESNGVKRVIRAGSVVNCTGPQENYLPAESGLFHQLLKHGLVQADEMNMGLKVAPNFSVTDKDGNSSKILFAMGALLKGTLWESTAVPELRSQAFRLAEMMAGELAVDAATRRPIVEVVDDVMEYSI